MPPWFRRANKVWSDLRIDWADSQFTPGRCPWANRWFPTHSLVHAKVMQLAKAAPTRWVDMDDLYMKVEYLGMGKEQFQVVIDKTSRWSWCRGRRTDDASAPISTQVGETE